LGSPTPRSWLALSEVVGGCWHSTCVTSVSLRALERSTSSLS